MIRQSSAASRPLPRRLTTAMTLLTLQILASSCSSGEDLTYQQHRVAATEARQAQDYSNFLEHTLAARNYSPHHQGLIYNTATAYALLGRPDDAMRELRRLVDMGLSYNLLGDADLGSLAQLRPFQTILTDMALNRVAILASRRLMVVAAPQAHIEGIAYDHTGHRTYFGAVRQRKILYRNDDGSLGDLSKPEDSLMAVLGVAIDDQRRILWAATAGLSQMENFTPALAGQSALVAYDLSSGEKLVEHHPAATEPRQYGFNDLAVAPDGTVFVSDSRGTLWSLPQGRAELQLLLMAQESFQGLALTDDGKTLFAAAYGSGVWRFDLAANRSSLLPYAADESLLGLDELEYRNGYLVGVQNGMRPYRILQMELSAAHDSIVTVTVLERNHPDHGEPTLGQIVGSDFIYVANSPWSKYGASGKWPAEADLDDIIILALPLD